MEWLWQLPRTRAILSVLSTIFLLQRQVFGLHIRPQQCYNSMGDAGTCMFVWECIKTEGKHLGTCADGFLFGSCCAHDSEENLIPSVEVPTTEIYQKPSSTSSVTKLSTTSTSNFFSSTTPVPQSVHVTSFTQRRPPYFKPSTSVNYVITKSTPKPTTESSSSFIITRPVYQSSTSRPEYTSAKTKPRPTTNKYGIINPNTQNWLHTSSFQSTYAPTKRPNYPTKASTTRHPTKVSTTRHPTKVSTTRYPTKATTTRHPTKVSTTRYPTKATTIRHPTKASTTRHPTKVSTTRHPTKVSTTRHPTKASTTRHPTVSHWTQKYTYVRPSWKPSTFKPFTTSALPPKPVIFTYTTNNYSTRPSFKPFTTKRPQEPFSTSAYSPLVTSAIKLNVTMPTVKTTTTFSIEKPVTVNTAVQVSNTSESFPLVTTSPSFSIPVTPNYTSFHSTASTLMDKTSENWFHPLGFKPISSTFSPTTSYSTTEVNLLTTKSTTQESYTTIYPKSSSSTVSETAIVEDYSSAATFEPAASVTTKTTTPLPVTPCGIPSPHPKKKVVGGKNSAFGSWPWQASVRRTSFFGFSSTHRCGGALISRQWVATAGHCVDDLLLSQIKIRVGEYDFASVQEPHGYVERGAKKKVVHPRYNFFTYENDLALVQLEEAIDPEKHPHISPICLPPSEENLVGKNATVTGWGRLSEGGVLPSILQEVQVPIISNEKCKNMFLAAGRHEYIPDIFMCAGFEEGGRDSCQGDSGGPLQIQADEGYWFLAGIISWGIGCAEPNMPGVCTRISKFKDWVVQQIT